MDGLPTEVPDSILGVVGLLVMGLLGTLGYLVKHVTGGDRAEVMRKLSELEAKQGEHALALQKEASERALADQRLSAKIQGVSRDIRTIHDLIEDTK
jgi:hypothetical protein